MLYYTKMSIASLCMLALLGAFPANAASLKLGFVTDWEYGSQKSVGHKLPSKAKTYLSSVVKYYNKTYKPDLVIGGGDYISSYSVSKSKAKKQLKSIVKTFRKTKAPRLYCIGNHDVRVLSKATVKKILKMKNPAQSVDTHGFRIITLDTNEPNSKGKFDIAGRMSKGDLDWLDQKLTTSLPVIIFSHHSPIATPYEDGGNRMNIYDSSKVRAVLEKHDNVVAVFSGHHPINYSEERNGITYVIINDLSSKPSKGAFATINLDKNANDVVTLNVKQYGKKPASYLITKDLSTR